VDVGSVRVGLARGSSLAKLAEPLKTVAYGHALPELEKLVAQKPTAGLVVGLPRSLDGHDTAQTGFVRDWVQRAKAQIKADFFWQDEALTTVAAKDSKSDIDAAAAAVILQDFFDAPESERVRC
jgi:putative Holliday junction resolvase